MRIIHNIGPKKTRQMTASGHAYRGKIGTENEWQGWYCELLISTRDVLTAAEQALEVEGDGDDLIDTLDAALKMLKGYREHLKQELARGRNVNPPALKVSEDREN